MPAPRPFTGMTLDRASTERKDPGRLAELREDPAAATVFGGEDGVLDAYPQLSPADVHDVLAFYEAHKAQIERHIRANLADD